MSLSLRCLYQVLPALELALLFPTYQSQASFRLDYQCGSEFLSSFCVFTSHFGEQWAKAVCRAAEEMLEVQYPVLSMGLVCSY